MRNNDEINELLQRVESRRGIQVAQHTTVEEAPHLDVDELSRYLGSSQETSAADIIGADIVSQELRDEIQSLTEKYVLPNLEESVEDVPLPEEVKDTYEGVIVRDETARFSSAEWFNMAKSFNITLAGIGGIGSWVALLLARLKPSYLRLFDPDRVELVNLAGQLYGIDDIGKTKVDAVCGYLINNANYYSYAEYTSAYGRGYSGTPVMICGFDSMRARKEFFSSWKSVTHNNGEGYKLFIDGRLSATEFQVFCMTGEDRGLMQRYEQEFLFDDSEASQEICSFKQTAYLANMIAGVMVNLYINFCANLCGSPFKKALPFITKYNTDMMMFNTEY